MDQDEALRALEDVEVIPCFQASISDAKELLAACLDQEIPALLDRGDCCGRGTCGCAPKVELLVRPEDAPRVAQLLKERWHGMLAREGTAEDWSAGTPEGDPPCPACGHTGPLAEGACSDCGLELA
jgi:hypothetical protein